MSLSIVKLHHIQLCAPFEKAEKAREFYLGKLGFQEINKPESLIKNGGFWCKAGNVELHIGLEEMEETKSKRHPAFQVEDLEASRCLLVKNNIKIQEETEIPGIQRLSFFDPFGNRIELLQIQKSEA
ncbi:MULTISPECIES: VOC family protein [Metabacillus]|uniref:VOC family protein n=1 Tax=Metabacillus hrfriensis TaxID=3048891 RepID=A0ACD4RHC6_9BACI|nr:MULTISPECIES: VOC family protein [Metabacillus]UAL54009.1 VOC family protein [Metabacillus dongyingensis]USK30326.1 VOC family protein [Bacillus sp. CMF21]WHZ59575.1 VOC family protein [Metabacillus sp. CT-WN-B3]